MADQEKAQDDARQAVINAIIRVAESVTKGEDVLALAEAWKIIHLADPAQATVNVY